MTGMRRGELCGLNWDDIDLENAKISIRRSYSESPRHGIILKEPKTAKSKRTFAIPDILVNALKEYKEWYETQRTLWGDRWVESGSVFIQRDGKRVHPANIKMWVNKTCKLSGIKHFSVHEHIIANNGRCTYCNGRRTSRTFKNKYNDRHLCLLYSKL